MDYLAPSLSRRGLRLEGARRNCFTENPDGTREVPSQKKLAQFIGRTPPQLSRYGSNTKDLPLKHQQALAEALHVSWEWLHRGDMGDDGEHGPPWLVMQIYAISSTIRLCAAIHIAHAFLQKACDPAIWDHRPATFNGFHPNTSDLFGLPDVTHGASYWMRPMALWEAFPQAEKLNFPRVYPVIQRAKLAIHDVFVSRPHLVKEAWTLMGPVLPVLAMASVESLVCRLDGPTLTEAAVTDFRDLIRTAIQKFPHPP
jgi:hypothetical protein